MTELKVLKIIWKKEKFKQYKDKILLEEQYEIYHFEENKSEYEISYVKEDVFKEIRQNLFYGILYLGVIFLGLIILSKIDSKSELLNNIASVFLIGLFIAAINVILIPFRPIKKVTFDLKFGLILKYNFLGISSNSIDLKTIKRVVSNHDKKRTYVTFREKTNDEVKNGSPIIILENQSEIENFNEFLLDILSENISIDNL
jgi:hypothetical protein